MSEVQNHQTKNSLIKRNKTDKSTDVIQKDLRIGFQWTVQHSKTVGIIGGVALLIGAGISINTAIREKAENNVQAQYFKAEKTLNEKKAKFEQAEQALKNKAAADSAKDKKAKADKVDAKALAEAQANKATGDFDKDYGTVAKDLEQIINKSPNSKAAKMAALQLSDVLSQYKKTDLALTTLKKVYEHNDSDLLSGMVAAQLGTIQANQNDCNSAIATWQKVLANAPAKSLHSEVKLKQGLCFESLKDFAKAEQAYDSILKDDKDGAIGKTAEKYLRLLKMNK